MNNPQQNSNRTKKRENRGIKFDGSPKLVSRPNRRVKRRLSMGGYMNGNSVKMIAPGENVERMSLGGNHGSSSFLLYGMGANQMW